MSTKWGTRGIGPKQTARAFHAVRFANDNGRTLNLLITVDFSSLGVEPEDAGAFFQRLWHRVGRWWAYQRKEKGRSFGPFDCYAVHEHPGGGPRHVHWFVRAPDDGRAELERIVRNRLEKMTGLACLGRAVHFLDVEKAGGVAKYTLKGVQPTYASHFHMKASDQGFIYGRRLAISRSIGATAREKAGWRRSRQGRES
ncbi:MAG: hypothetical protein QOH81_1092 [Sphingomonadales bacterium]|jgi:hypothetical protein|nr:hypothetical protein [Sphingomonadales bacterium]